MPLAQVVAALDDDEADDDEADDDEAELARLQTQADVPPELDR